jgi:hypothetical protein
MMNTNNKFSAPWSKQLTLMTIVCHVICIGIAVIGMVSPGHPVTRLSMIVLPLLVLISGSLFMIRGYTLNNGRLIVHRLGWDSLVDLASLASVVHDPSAMSGSVRTAGNGGLFAFCGWFYNRKLGSYRAFGTDPHRAVVLRFANRVVVVTPDAPERLVDEITKAK